MYKYFMRFESETVANEFLADYFEETAGTDLTAGNKSAVKLGFQSMGMDENGAPVYVSSESGQPFYFVHMASETSLSKPGPYLVPDGEPRPLHGWLGD